MAAADWLEPSVVEYLIAQFGSTGAAAVEAMQLPGFEDEFPAQTGATLVSGDDGSLYPSNIARSSDRAYWKLVEAAVGPSSQHARSRGTAALVEDAARVELDLGGGPYSPVALAAVGKEFARDPNVSIRPCAKAAGLSYRLTRRVHSWFKAGALLWDESRGLRAGPGYRLIPVGPRRKLIRLDPSTGGSPLPPSV